MRLLLVEDDEDKREQLLMFFDEHFTFSVDEVRSFQSALKAIKTICYDLIILDMTIPTYDTVSYTHLTLQTNREV